MKKQAFSLLLLSVDPTPDPSPSKEMGIGISPAGRGIEVEGRFPLSHRERARVGVHGYNNSAQDI